MFKKSCFRGLLVNETSSPAGRLLLVCDTLQVEFETGSAKIGSASLGVDGVKNCSIFYPVAFLLVVVEDAKTCVLWARGQELRRNQWVVRIGSVFFSSRQLTYPFFRFLIHRKGLHFWQAFHLPFLLSFEANAVINRGNSITKLCFDWVRAFCWVQDYCVSLEIVAILSFKKLWK